MSACDLVISEITHTRHAGPHHSATHFLRRAGLSLWIDLDQLDKAARQSRLFSVDRFNLLAFFQADYGPNFKSKAPLIPLADYVRGIANDLIPDKQVTSVHLLTFPRILGAVFNPLSVYVARDAADADILYIYEVRNTFGDMHAYIGTPNGEGAVLSAAKVFHVSPFFPVEGVYRLRLCIRDNQVNLAMRYRINDAPALTATMRGTVLALSSGRLLRLMLQARQFPFRPIVAIHIEALKLWIKKVPFFARPNPPSGWSRADDFNEVD